MTKEINFINNVRNSRNLDLFDMLSTDCSHRQAIRQRMKVLRQERAERQHSAPPGYANDVSYPEEYWCLQRELMRLNGILGV